MAVTDQRRRRGAQAVGLAFPVIDAAGVWWQESRPPEGGRVAVVRQGPDGAKRDLLPMPWNARTRVHEYGGQVVPAAAGRVRLRELRRPAAVPVRAARRRPEPLTPAPDRAMTADRFADLVLSPAGTRCGASGSGTCWPGWRRPDHPRDRGGPAGRLGRGRSRRDPGPGQRRALLRLPDAVAGRHPAGLDLLGPPPDAVGRHRAAGRGARRRRAGQRQAPAAADHGRRHRVGAGPGLARRPTACT